MSNFPKWLLALAGINLIPILLCPFFLFGGLHPFGTSEYTIVSFLLYILTQLLWLIPIGAFFLGLDLYNRYFSWPGIAVCVIGAMFTVADIVLLLVA